MSRKNQPANLDILSALGDAEGDEVAEKDVPKVLEVPRQAKKAPPKQTQQQKAAPQAQYQAYVKTPGMPPLIKCPPEIMRYTKICSFIQAGKRCPHGSKCEFAHDEATFRKHKLIWTRYVAQERAKLGWVPEGRRPGNDAASGPKSAPCIHWERTGRCVYGDRCGYSHGESSSSSASGAGPSRPFPGSQQYHYSGYDSGAGPSGSSSAAAAEPTAPTAMSAEQLAQLYNDMDLSDDDEDNLPGAFICPLSMVRFKDPVVAADGYSYERELIEAWFINNNTSPYTNEELDDKSLVPNLTLMAAMKIVLGEDCFEY